MKKTINIKFFTSFIPLILLNVCILISFPLGNLYADADIEEITFLTETYPPFNFKSNGKLQGIAVDLILKMLEQAGASKNQKDFLLLPWAQAYEKTLSENKTCLFAMTRTREREHLFKWVGPFASSKIVLIAPKSKQVKITSIADLKNYAIGVVREDIGEQLLVEKGVQKESLKAVHDPIVNADRLVSGQIDLWACGDVVANWIMKENGINPDDYEAVYVLKQGEQYFAFNINTPDEMINALQQALERLFAQGTHKKIIDQYQKLEQFLGCEKTNIDDETTFTKDEVWKTAFPPAQFTLDCAVTNVLAKTFNAVLLGHQTPFARRLKQLEQGKIDLLAGLLKTPEREQYAYFLDPPYKEKSNKFFFVKKGEGFRLKEYQDLYKLKVGVQINSKYFPRFDNDNRINKIETSNIEGRFLMLSIGRIDALIHTDIYGLHVMQKLELNNRVEVAPFKYTKYNPVYIAISKRSKLIRQKKNIENEFRLMIKSGEVDKIIHNFFSGHGIPIPEYK